MAEQTGGIYDAVVTQNGGILLADAMAKNGELDFTKISIGKGYLPAGKTVMQMTAMSDPVTNITQLRKSRTTDLSEVVVEGTFTNAEVTQGFYYREYGIFAKVKYPDNTYSPETLYIYGNAGDSAEFIPAHGGSVAVTKSITNQIYVGGETRVVLQIADGLTATKEELDQAIDDLSATIASNKTALESSIAGVNSALNTTKAGLEDDISELTTSVNAKIPTSQKGVAGGVPSLDATGKIPQRQLPSVGISENDVKSMIASGQDVIFSNVAIPAASWTSTSAYTYAKYQATISLAGVTSDMDAEVFFSPNDADSGMFSGGGLVNNGSITLLAIKQPTSNITIPKIRVMKSADAIDLTPDYYIPTSLQATSWANIKRVCDEGNAQVYFNIGDEKTVELTNGETITVQIADFNHDTYTAGGIAPISFVMKNCLSTKKQMNATNTNAGGWQDSAMRTYCNGDLLNLFPTDLKNLIKQINKKGYAGTTNTIQTTADYLWLLAEVEIFGSNSYSAGTAEGSLYPIFTDNTSRIKQVNGSNDRWWERSPSESSDAGFCDVYSNGGAYAYTSSILEGVAIGFCI